MTVAQLLALWVARRDEYQRVGATVDGVRLCEEVLSDLGRFETFTEEPTFKLREAARRSGYSEDHLGRLVRAGKIPNAGRPGAPRIRLSDLPIKAGALRNSLSGLILSNTEIARAVITQQPGGTR